MVIASDPSDGNGDVVFSKFLKTELDKLLHTIVVEFHRLSSDTSGSISRRRSLNDVQVFRKPIEIHRNGEYVRDLKRGTIEHEFFGQGPELPGVVAEKTPVPKSIPQISEKVLSQKSLLAEAEAELQKMEHSEADEDDSESSKSEESSSEQSERTKLAGMEIQRKKDVDPDGRLDDDDDDGLDSASNCEETPVRPISSSQRSKSEGNNEQGEADGCSEHDDDESGTSDEQTQYKVLDAWYVRFGSRLDRQRTNIRDLHLSGRKSSFDAGINANMFGSQGEFGFDRGLRENIVAFLQSYMLHPNAKKALLWNVVSLIFVFFDLIAIPLNVFEPQDNWFRVLCRTLTQCFWTFDIIFMFFIGYTSAEGTMILAPGQVAKRYLRSRVILDFTLVTCSWITAFLNDSQKKSLKVITGINIFEAVQLLRIHRLSHLWRLGDQMFLYVQSEEKLLVAYISMIIFLLLELIHIIGCMWFWVSDASYISSPDVSMFEAYMECVHIALALLVGEHVGQYRNLQQRCFTVCALLFGFILCAAFVGALTTAMSRLQSVSRKRAGMFSSLHRFLTQHNVTSELSIRLNRNARFTLAQHKLHIQERDVELLHHVSDALKAELHYEIHSPRLMVHPFLHVFNRLQFRAIQNICDTAVMPINVSRGDILFTVLELPHRPAMYFCRPGSVHYFVAEFRGSHQMAYQCSCGKIFKEDSLFCRKCGAKRQEDVVAQKLRGTAIKEERCLAEASLWTTWTHAGTAKAVKESQLLSLDAQRFGHIMRKVHLPHVWQYACRFVEYLNTSAQPGGATDLGPDVHEWRRMVTGVFTEQDGEFKAPPEWDSHGERRRRSSLFSHMSAYSQKSAFSVPSLNVAPIMR